MLYRLGHGAARHKWWVLGAWLVVLVGLGTAAGLVGGQAKNSFTIPGAESQEALDLLESDFPDASGPNAKVVFHATGGDDVTDSGKSKAIGQSVENFSKLDGVGSATNPTAEPYSLVDVSSDKTISYSTITYSVTLENLPDDAFDQIKAAKPARDAGLDVEYGGTVVDIQDPLDPGISKYSDEIGLAVALVILIILFGRVVVAGGLPIGVALAALGVSTAAIVLLENVFTIGTLNPVFGTMIGLGVGVDYSLLVVNRYLQDRHGGFGVADAAGRASTTAGRAVLFAGFMICLATIALAVIGIPYVTVLGITSAMYVAFTMIAAITLLPALLGALGHHVEALAFWVRRRHERGDDGPPFFEVGRRRPSTALALRGHRPRRPRRPRRPDAQRRPRLRQRRERPREHDPAPGLRPAPPGSARASTARCSSRSRCPRRARAPPNPMPATSPRRSTRPTTCPRRSARSPTATRRRPSSRSPRPRAPARRRPRTSSATSATTSSPTPSAGTERRRRLRRRHDGGEHRLHRPHRGPPGALHRRGARRSAAPAPRGPPVDRDPDQGGGPEPRDVRRRDGRRGGGVPVGLGPRSSVSTGARRSSR
ncbi:MAG: MMPL family transporter [Acidimicrobiia bacterium]|nr:MMPL family transporter [Acidimicrobiia bacterium]